MFTEITLIDYARPLKARAEARRCVGPYRWTPAKPGNGRGFYQASKGLYCDPRGSSFDLRLEEANNYLGGRLSQINGYYCDRDGDGDTLQPIIARLPHGRGFLAGWTMGAGMCASLDAYVYETPEDAAHAAHSMAENDAEKNREAEEQDRESYSDEQDRENYSA